MSWFVEGSSSKLHFHISEVGDRSIWGDALEHDPSPWRDTGDIDFRERLGAARCSFSILSSDATEEEIELAGEGLFKRVSENPKETQVSIHLFDDPLFVGMGIVLPEKKFDLVWSLLRDVLFNMDLRYLITVEFVGFSSTGASLTLADFKSGMPYFTNEISFTIRRDDA